MVKLFGYRPSPFNRISNRLIIFINLIHYYLFSFSKVSVY